MKHPELDRKVRELAELHIQNANAIVSNMLANYGAELNPQEVMTVMYNKAISCYLENNGVYDDSSAALIETIKEIVEYPVKPTMDDLKKFCERRDEYRNVEREIWDEKDCHPQICYSSPSHYWCTWDVAGSISSILQQVQKGEYDPQEDHWIQLGKFPLILE